MSDDTLPSILNDSAQLPAHLQAYAETADDAKGLVTGTAGLPKLSIRGKQFRFTEGNDEKVLPMGTPLRVVILAVDPELGTCKAYYEGAWTADADSPPDCTSADGIKPDADVANPKSATCDGCEFNAWGSAKDQAGNFTKGKACSDVKILFLVNAEHVNGTMLALRVPATSLKALSAFGKSLHRRQVPMQGVITELSFEDETHPQLKFTPVGWLDEADTKICMERKGSDELLDALPSKYAASATTEPVKVLDAPKASKSPPPPPPPKLAQKAEPEYEMTALADGKSMEAFIKKGWSIPQLISNKYMTLKGAK